MAISVVRASLQSEGADTFAVLFTCGRETSQGKKEINPARWPLFSSLLFVFERLRKNVDVLT